MFIPLKGLAAQTRKVRLETEGFTGEACINATRQLEEAIGGSGVEQEYTPEFYEPDQRHETLTDGDS